MGKSGAGSGFVVKAVPRDWETSTSWRTAAILEGADGHLEHLGWVATAHWQIGLSGELELQLENGATLRLQRVCRLPLAPPAPERPTVEIAVLAPLSPVVPAATHRAADPSVADLARDYLREIETFVDDDPDEVTVEDRQPGGRRRRPTEQHTDVQWGAR